MAGRAIVRPSALVFLGTTSLYGPGLVIEVPSAADIFNQLMANVDDEETAWPVLARI